MKSYIKDWFDAVNVKWFFLGILVYSGILSLLIYGFIGPNRTRYDESLKNQSAINDMYINLIGIDIDASLNEVNQQIAEYKTLENKFRSRIFDASETKTIIPQLDQLLRSANLKVTQLVPNDSEKKLKGKHRKKFIATTVTGQFDDLLDFVRIIETHPKWLLLESIRITPAGKDEQLRTSMLISYIYE